jgi:hypothetical protein
MAGFVRIGSLNAEQFFNEGKLEKGVLVKHRIHHHTMVTYTHSTLDPCDYQWQFGIVSEVLWYARTPQLPSISNQLVGGGEYPIVYDLTVYNTQANKKDYLDFHNYEIMILVE